MRLPDPATIAIAIFAAITAVAPVVAAVSNPASDALPPPIPAEPLKKPLPVEPSEKPPAGNARAEPRMSRGQLLYENHCTGCHTSIAHVRSDRRARTVKELEAWVMRWAGERRLTWSAGDIADVVDYLDRRYYHFTPNGSKP